MRPRGATHRFVAFCEGTWGQTPANIPLPTRVVLWFTTYAPTNWTFKLFQRLRERLCEGPDPR